MLSANVEAGVVAQAVSPAYSELENRPDVSHVYGCCTGLLLVNAKAEQPWKRVAGDTLEAPQSSLPDFCHETATVFYGIAKLVRAHIGAGA